jgi:hypothetical protein
VKPSGSKKPNGAVMPGIARTLKSALCMRTSDRTTGATGPANDREEAWAIARLMVDGDAGLHLDTTRSRKSHLCGTMSPLLLLGSALAFQLRAPPLNVASRRASGSVVMAADADAVRSALADLQAQQSKLNALLATMEEPAPAPAPVAVPTPPPVVAAVPTPPPVAVPTPPPVVPATEFVMPTPPVVPTMPAVEAPPMPAMELVVPPMPAVVAPTPVVPEIGAQWMMPAAEPVVDAVAKTSGTDGLFTAVVLFTAIPVSTLAVVWLAGQVGISLPKRAPAAERATGAADAPLSLGAGTDGGNTGRSAADIFSKGLENLLNDPTGWLFGEPSALYSNLPVAYSSSSAASPMSSAQGFGARKGAKELAREQAALGDMDGVVTPTPVKAPTAPRE